MDDKKEKGPPPTAPKQESHDDEQFDWPDIDKMGQDEIKDELTE